MSELDKVYLVDEKYPDPYQIRDIVLQTTDPDRLKSLLSDIDQTGMSSHPLLSKFFVES